MDFLGGCPPAKGGKGEAVRTRSQNSEVRIQKRFVCLLAFILLATGALAAQEDETRHARMFAEAAKAYDENRLAEAIAGWNQLADTGQALPEVLFNLGNAYYRNGQVGPAIRAYRQAQRQAPRDPDIRANLGFAAQTAGSPLPARKPVAALLLDFSPAEWRGVAVACYWGLFAAFAAWILWPRQRLAARLATAAFALCLLVALTGLWLHRDLRKTPEGVVMLAGQKVLSSPLETATPLLAIPEGAIVRMLEKRGPWIEIRYEETRGWLPAETVAAVLPETPSYSAAGPAGRTGIDIPG